MDIADNIGLSEAKQVIIALEVGMPVGKTITSKMFFLQSMALNHSTHSAI